ncbi:MAG: XTP/dITP diphosphatase [Candidatus Dadabacteria bacterium]|nr:XTP/dITP diphosphatase [Candidatus Dadabacteria bacterium]NIQ12890.1 XTP/dITP diphosphatase [Candidatus Dadabacteria bacterium]
MTKSIIIATRNKGKLKEFKSILKNNYDEILSLHDFDDIPEIVEDGASFNENAYKKAKVISDYLKTDTIADDSGIVVEALDGAPGIYSARFAGVDATDEDNIDKLLSEMKDIDNRKAKFVCSIALVNKNGEHKFFSGECKGIITKEKKGSHGFGYDPVFYLPEYGKTMAEISPELKNKISHRSKALQKLISHLN